MQSTPNSHHNHDARVWHPVHAVMATDTPSTGTPSTDPMAPWKQWCATISIADGVAHALYQLVTDRTIPIPERMLTDFRAGLYALNDGFVQVDDAFTQYIKSGDASVFDIAPPAVQPWSDPDAAPTQTHLTYFEAGFEALEGMLTLLSGKIQSELDGHPELKVVYDALAILVTNEQSVITAIKKVLPA